MSANGEKTPSLGRIFSRIFKVYNILFSNKLQEKKYAKHPFLAQKSPLRYNYSYYQIQL